MTAGGRNLIEWFLKRKGVSSTVWSHDYFVCEDRFESVPTFLLLDFEFSLRFMIKVKK